MRYATSQLPFSWKYVMEWQLNHTFSHSQERLCYTTQPTLTMEPALILPCMVLGRLFQEGICTCQGVQPMRPIESPESSHICILVTWAGEKETVWAEGTWSGTCYFHPTLACCVGYWRYGPSCYHILQETWLHDQWEEEHSVQSNHELDLLQLEFCSAKSIIHVD